MNPTEWAKRFNSDEDTFNRLRAWADENPRIMDINCGNCGLLLPCDSTFCQGCGHVLKVEQ